MANGGLAEEKFRLAPVDKELPTNCCNSSRLDIIEIVSVVLS